MHRSYVLLIAIFLPLLLRSQNLDSLIQTAWQLRGSDPSQSLSLAKKGYYFSRDDPRTHSIFANIIGVNFKNLGSKDSAKHYFEVGLSIRRRIGDTLLISRSLNNLGNLHRKAGAYGAALNYYEEAYQYLVKIGDTLELAKVANHLGLVNKNLGNYQVGLEYLYEGLSYNESLKNPQGIGESYLSLGNYFESAGADEKAHTFYQQSLSIFKKTGSLLNQGKALQNLGNIAIRRQNWNHSRQFYLQSIQLFEELRYTPGLANAYNNLGVSNEELGNLEKSRSWYDKGLNAQRTLGNQRGEAEVLNNLGKLLIFNNQPELGVGLLEQAYAIVEDIGHYLIIDEVLSNLANGYAQLNQFEKAFELHQQLISAKELHFAELSKAKELELQYQEAQSQLKIQQAQIEQNQAEISARRVWNIALALVTALILILLVLALFSNQQNIKRLASEQRFNQLRKEQEAKSIRAMLIGQENERGRIAAEIHDSLSVQLVAARMGFEGVSESLNDPKSVERQARSISLLDQAFESIRRIVHAMHPRTLETYGLIKAVTELLNNVKSSSDLQVEFSHSDWIQRLPKFIEVNLYRILEELMGNILRHAKATHITIKIEVEADILSLAVVDNGSGFSLSEQSQGLGLENIRTRVKDLGGQLSLESIPGKGTTIFINQVNCAADEHY